jgi:hypothetical protein
MQEITSEAWEALWVNEGSGDHVWAGVASFNPALRVLALCVDDNGVPSAAASLEQLNHGFEAPVHRIALSNDSIIDGVVKAAGKASCEALHFFDGKNESKKFHGEGRVSSKEDTDESPSCCKIDFKIAPQDVSISPDTTVTGELDFYVAGRGGRLERDGLVRYQIRLQGAVTPQLLQSRPSDKMVRR